MANDGRPDPPCHAARRSLTGPGGTVGVPGVYGDVNADQRETVLDMLRRRRSPQQIGARLPVQFPDTPEMWVSHETIYRRFICRRGVTCVPS